ncbi:MULTISPECIES: transaldolase family protein [unclassified Schaalia]|uniref:transaldolase family protein n=1 Tax=unclassified Schaalia TaxID=2691889 RepID=UPI001E538F78|nr:MULTISPECIES: transaldolase family protein [unclassified Schaalia]MCD4549803.1 fructose-6-phosphate aldolase [Schaalia sp. lx-260]MCD4556819.1 fructose-6-phosphate aldolase [Schaalia sp. lx-100]
MLILIDDADPKAIEDTLSFLPVDGVTTNPAILARYGADPLATLKRIKEILPFGSQMHAQLVSTTTEGMLAEAAALRETLGEHIFVKVPVTREGYAAMPLLKQRGFYITATGIHSAMQGFMAAKAGCRYIAPYVNRMDNYGISGVRVAADMHRMLRAQGIQSDVLAASFKNSEQVLELVRDGIGAITAAPDVLAHLVSNPATDMAIHEQNADFAGLVGGPMTWADLVAATGEK